MTAEVNIEIIGVKLDISSYNNNATLTDHVSQANIYEVTVNELG